MKKTTLAAIMATVAISLTAQDMIYIYLHGGEVIEIESSNLDSISLVGPKEHEQQEPPEQKETVKDICGNEYATVRIGEQVWMAENIRCNKYDTKSEAYNAPWLTNNTVPKCEDTYLDEIYTPYYIDASDKSKWTEENAENLTDSQIKKLGYLLNWAAAVGVKEGSSLSEPFEKDRQGICPNGWHIPSKKEWWELIDHIYEDQSIPTDGSVPCRQWGNYNICGKYLKTKTGWHNGGNGLDTYGFAALPAGCAFTNETVRTGEVSYFWANEPFTAINPEEDIRSAFEQHVKYDNEYLTETGQPMRLGFSVRCIKDREPEPKPIQMEKAKDICGNEYTTVKIGRQIWMAENMRCNRYDTESEAYNAPWLIKNTIQTTQTVSMIPYYIDPTDPTNESKWDKDKNHPEGMTDEQISKIGFYYNWAATIGVADGEKQTKEFKGKRQGICPNGWHVPSREEYMDLEEYIYEDQNIPKDGTVPYRRGEGGTIASSYTICGTYLKSKTGWHNEGNGLDTYGFNALPAGYIYLSSNIVEIGQRELLWTSTNYYDEEKLAVDRDIDEDTNEFREQGSRKETGISVRCIKD